MVSIDPEGRSEGAEWGAAQIAWAAAPAGTAKTKAAMSAAGSVFSCMAPRRARGH